MPLQVVKRRTEVNKVNVDEALAANNAEWGLARVYRCSDTNEYVAFSEGAETGTGNQGSTFDWNGVAPPVRSSYGQTGRAQYLVRSKNDLKVVFLERFPGHVIPKLKEDIVACLMGEIEPVKEVTKPAKSSNPIPAVDVDEDDEDTDDEGEDDEE